MRPSRVAANLGLCAVASCSGARSPENVPSRLPATRAERSHYLETSHYDDVVAFLDSLKKLGAPLAFGSIGRTSESREIPYVLASRPLVHTPAEARATGKPIVYTSRGTFMRARSKEKKRSRHSSGI